MLKKIQAMPKSLPIKTLIRNLSKFENQLRHLREIVLANAVMFGEIPAPTGEESLRIRFLSDRFTECSLQPISIDEMGNAIGIMSGKKKKRNILLVAHADTVFPSSVNHTVSVSSNSVVGPGIADNSLGLATLASLPTIIEKLGLSLNSNLILLGVTRSLGEGNLEGIRFFLDHFEQPIHAAVCLEGVHLGRLSYSSMGMLRGEITCRIKEEADSSGFSSTGAIVDLQKILKGMLSIPTPLVPRTSIILGSVSAGTAFNTTPRKGRLRFEVRSEDAAIVENIRLRIEEITEEVAAEGKTTTSMKTIATRQPGGIAFGHPLVKSTRQIMEKLAIEPIYAPSVGELSALIDKGIPGITLGLTKGEEIHEPNETITIEPLYRGLAQLLGVLLAIDKGVCNEN